MLVLTKSMTALDARMGKAARQSIARLEKLIPLTPIEFLHKPEHQLTLAEIYFRLGRNVEGCEILKSIASVNIAQPSLLFVRYRFLEGTCHSGEDPDSVIACYQSALDQLMATQTQGTWLEIKIRRGLGNVLRNRDPEAALKYYLREAEILDQVFIPDHIETAGAHYNAGNVYFELLDYTQALSEYKKAYPGFAKRYQPADRYMRFINEAIGDMFWELGQKDSSLIYYDRSVIDEDIVNNDTGEKMKDAGDSLMKSGLTDNALKYYRSALAFRKDQFGIQHPLTGACNNFIARVYQRHGHTEEAMRIYQESLQGFASDFSDSSLYSNPALNQIEIGSELFAIEAFMAKADGFIERYNQYTSTKEIDAAQHSIDLCMQLIERSRAFPVSEGSKLFLSDMAHPVYERAVHIALIRYQATNDKIYLHSAFEASEKSKAYTLVQAMQFEAKGYRDLPKQVLMREKELKMAITDYGGKIVREEKRCDETRDKKLASWKNKLDQLYSEYSTFLRQLRIDYPEYYSMRHSMDVITIPALQEIIQEETIVMSLFQGENRLTVFGITKGSALVFEFPIDTSYLKSAETLLLQLKAPATNDLSDRASWQSICQHFYDAYFKMLLDQLPGKNKLIVLPDGVLAYIPFEILLQPLPIRQQSNLAFTMLENYAISYSPSATVLAHSVQAKQGSISSFSGFAPPYGGSTGTATHGSQWLKYNIAEVENLSLLFRKSKLYTGKIARDQFLDKSASAEILHLAMHTEIDSDEPMLSYFLLSDEEGEEHKVYAYEIQSRTMHAQHAVLSACNTGIGQLRKGEGMMSLSRCFQYAGCQSMVVSLWPVDDLATSELMQYYYTHLLKGLPKDIALQKAKLDYLIHADPATRHPYYWAGFVLIGNTNPIRISEFPIWWVLIGLCAVSLLIWLYLKNYFFGGRLAEPGLDKS